jgi:membrane protease YdiL (CAAX protease family)
VQLFEAGFSTVVEWITQKPFPVQIALPAIREALQTNPITVVASIVFLAPMAEEVLFRGLLFGALQRWLSARGTILLTAMLFALIHVQAIYFLPIFLVGVLCGWARHKSGSLAVPMLLHILNNGISLVLMQLFPEAT